MTRPAEPEGNPTPAAPSPISITEHAGLIRHVISRFGFGRRAIYALDLKDLTQQGWLALLRAAETYDPERSKFSTYAIPWIRQSIGRHLQDRGSSVRVPVHAQEKRAKTGERPTPWVGRLDMRLAYDSDETRLDLLAYPETPDAEDVLDTKRAPGRVAALFAAAKLTAQERRVLRMRTNDRTLLEVGTELHLSRERVRQIERDALAKLRRAAGVRADAPRVSLSPKPRAPSGSVKRETPRRLRNESPCPTMQIDHEPKV